MIQVVISVQQRGPHIVTELKATADADATENEAAMVDKIAESVTGIIAGEGGSGVFRRHEPPVDPTGNGRTVGS